MLRDVPDEAMPELFYVRNCHRVKEASPSPMQSSLDTLFFLGLRKTPNSTEHRTEHFPMDGANCCITSQTHASSSFSPSEDQKSSPLRGSFYYVRVFLNEEHRTAKWFLRQAPPYPRKVQGNHCFGSCSWFSPQTTQRKTTSSLICNAELCSGSPPD